MFKFQKIFSLNEIGQQCIGNKKSITLLKRPSIVGKHSNGILILTWDQKSKVLIVLLLFFGRNIFLFFIL